MGSVYEVLNPKYIRNANSINYMIMKVMWWSTNLKVNNEAFTTSHTIKLIHRQLKGYWSPCCLDHFSSTFSLNFGIFSLFQGSSVSWYKLCSFSKQFHLFFYAYYKLIWRAGFLFSSIPSKSSMSTISFLMLMSWSNSMLLRSILPGKNALCWDDY